jgi:uncharacterized membrane protein
MAIEHTIARLLTWGTYLGVASLAIGVVAMLAAGISPLDPGYPPFDIGSVPDDMLALRPAGFLWAGLLIVIATPPARVATALVGYLAARERAMAAISAGILVVIAAAVALGAGGG